jgi:hypothetical protein
MKETYGSFIGGTQVRYSATGIDLEEVFLDDDIGEQRLQLAVREIKSFFDFLNTHTLKQDETYDKTRSITTIEGIHDRVMLALSNLDTDPLVQNGTKMQIGEFRLLLVTQICALAGIHLKEHPILTQFLYIAEGTGGYNMLKECSMLGQSQGPPNSQRGAGKKKFSYTVEQRSCIMLALATQLRIGSLDQYNGHQRAAAFNIWHKNMHHNIQW